MMSMNEVQSMSFSEAPKDPQSQSERLSKKKKEKVQAVGRHLRNHLMLLHELLKSFYSFRYNY